MERGGAARRRTSPSEGRRSGVVGTRNESGLAELATERSCSRLREAIASERASRVSRSPRFSPVKTRLSLSLSSYLVAPLVVSRRIAAIRFARVVTSVVRVRTHASRVSVPRVSNVCIVVRLGCIRHVDYRRPEGTRRGTRPHGESTFYSCDKKRRGATADFERAPRALSAIRLSRWRRRSRPANTQKRTTFETVRPRRRQRLRPSSTRSTFPLRSATSSAPSPPRFSRLFRNLRLRFRVLFPRGPSHLFRSQLRDSGAPISASECTST